MHRNFLTLFLLVALLSIGNLSVRAQGTIPTAPEPQDGSVVCPPGIYTSTPYDCLPLGPSEYLTQNAAQGIPYPSRRCRPIPPIQV